MNIQDSEGEARWIDAGRPLVPCLLVGEVASPILHVSQLASMLGLEAPEQPPATRLAWDAASVLGAWLGLIRPLDLQTLTAPTPSRGRSLRNLTVNVFHPFELLPTAFETGHFGWNPELDAEREAALQDPVAIVAYASDRHVAWEDWLREKETDLLISDPQIRSTRGRVSYAALLDSQRWHAAFHYRQVLTILDEQGHEVAGALSLSSLDDLTLPTEIF